MQDLINSEAEKFIKKLENSNGINYNVRIYNKNTYFYTYDEALNFAKKAIILRDRETASKEIQRLKKEHPIEFYPMNLIDVIFPDGLDDYDCDISYVFENFHDNLNYIIEHGKLTPRETLVITRRYQELETLKEIGDYLGVSRERTRQIEFKALRKLKHPSNSNILFYGYEVVNLKKSIEAIKKDLEAEKTRLYSELRRLKTMGLNDQEIKEYEASKDSILNEPIETLGLSVRSYNCLARKGIKTLRRLISLSEAELSHFKNLGHKILKEIKNKLCQYDLRLKDEEYAY